MRTLKYIINYAFWIAMSLVFGIGYLRIVLGANNTSDDGIGYLFNMFYYWGLFHVGMIVGLVIAVLFIFLDVFYLRKKLKNNFQSTIKRFLSLMVIAILVGITHYILEKVIDVI